MISAETAMPVLAMACSSKGYLANDVCLWQAGTRCSWSVCVLSEPLYPVYLQSLWLSLPYGGTPPRFRSLCPDKHQTALTPACLHCFLLDLSATLYHSPNTAYLSNIEYLISSSHPPPRLQMHMLAVTYHPTLS